jgi:hypothetical protein
MIFFLNRGLILEQEVVKVLKKYFDITGVPDYYKNYTINITNEHPFAKMYLSEAPEKTAISLFPVVVVATESESKPSELINLIDTAENISIEPGDITKGEDDKSVIEKRYDMITPQIIEKLQEAMNKRDDKRILGMSIFIRRRETICIDIWAENPQLKNELYELVRLFACGFLRDYLADLYRRYFGELGDGQSPLVIFDSSVKGQRSNNYNLDFGIELCAGQITFEADYIIEQTIIDTEIVDENNILLEVINHVKGHEHSTRERVIWDDSADESTWTDAKSTDSGEAEEEAST